MRWAGGTSPSVATTLVDKPSAQPGWSLNGDGELSADERRDAKDAAVRAARSYLGARGVAELCKVLGLVDDEVERLLAARVEGAVYNLRAHPSRMLGSVLRSALKNVVPPPGSPNGAH